MNYQETLDYLFSALPMFQRQGASAFKKDLSNTILLCRHLGNPQENFKSVHVAGTNGKGSTSHAISAILQDAGYKVGLYTSPHLKSFTERIKINGQEISQEEVVRFVGDHQNFLEQVKPSFFEMTVALAFDHFSRHCVDIAVVEVGMGGKFDSTNILHPILSIITSIGMDHTQFLGDNLEKIAGEKAGIIKSNIPVVISQTQKETRHVFQESAIEKTAPVYFADQNYKMEALPWSTKDLLRKYRVSTSESTWLVGLDLMGKYQIKNLPGILQAFDLLKQKGFIIHNNHIINGLSSVIVKTGLKGRWQKLQEDPLVYCDAGHNKDGIKEILEQIASIPYRKLHIIFGVVEDKEVGDVLSMLPKNAGYTFCQADIPRALDAEILKEKAALHGLNGQVIKKVNRALEIVLKSADKDDLVFIGGSTFVVAELENL